MSVEGKKLHCFFLKFRMHFVLISKVKVNVYALGAKMIFSLKIRMQVCMYVCIYVCLFFSLHFWRVTHRTHKLELLYTLGKG